MNLFSHPPAKKSGNDPDIHPLVPLHEVEQNTSEGGEFLDDAIRSEDLFPIHTEECVASGSPGNLL